MYHCTGSNGVLWSVQLLVIVGWGGKGKFDTQLHVTRINK